MWSLNTLLLVLVSFFVGVAAGLAGCKAMRRLGLWLDAELLPSRYLKRSKRRRTKSHTALTLPTASTKNPHEHPVG